VTARLVPGKALSPWTLETLENLLGMLGGGLNGGTALTPDGNLSLIDDIGSPTASGKQFITGGNEERQCVLSHYRP